jgi:hypothetical protein
VGNLMHKPCLYADEATAWFMRQSKAALADMLTEVMRLESGRCDDGATAEAAEQKFAPVLAARTKLRGLPKRMDPETRSRFLETGGWQPRGEVE